MAKRFFSLSTYCIVFWGRVKAAFKSSCVSLRCFGDVKPYLGGFINLLYDGLRGSFDEENANLNNLWLVLQQTSPGCRRIDCRSKTNPEVRSIDPIVVILKLNGRILFCIYCCMKHRICHLDRFLAEPSEHTNCQQSGVEFTWYEFGKETSWLWINEPSGLQSPSIIGWASLAIADSRSSQDHC